MFLSELHRQDLIKSGLSAETISQSGFYSAPEAETRSILGYGTGPGMVMPYRPWRDGLEAFWRVKIDNKPPDGKRYRSPKGSLNKVYMPPNFPKGVLEDAGRAIYVTEGEKKALRACQDGIPTIALAGVWSWKRRMHGKSLSIPDFDFIEWRNRIVVVVYDSDAAEKPPVAWAEHALVLELRSRGADVFVVRLPHGENDAKQGLDDYLMASGKDAFKAIPMLSIAEVDKGQPKFLRMSDLADQYLARSLSMGNRIRFGMGMFDDVMRGIAPGEVMVVMGRAGVGKTAFALNLIDNMTTKTRIPTMKVSLEMQGVELFERVASFTLEKEGRVIEELAAREDEFLIEAFRDQVIPRWNHVVISDQPCNITKLDALIGEAKHADFWPDPLRLVVIDYLGMIGSSKKGGSTYEQVSEVAREVKNIAKRHDVSIIVLCQVGREGDTGGEPISMRSGRDSGVIEEAADYIIGLWRPALAADLTDIQREERKEKMIARVLKNRCGPAPATLHMNWKAMILKITGGYLADDDGNPVDVHGNRLRGDHVDYVPSTVPIVGRD